MLLSQGSDPTIQALGWPKISKGLLMVVSKQWLEFSGGTDFRYPLLTSVLPSFLPLFYLLLTSFLPLFNLNLTSASSRISNHGLETTVYIPLGYERGPHYGNEPRRLQTKIPESTLM